MKIEKFFLMFVIPILVFILSCTDVQAEEINRYEITSYYSSSSTENKVDTLIESDLDIVLYDTGTMWGTNSDVHFYNFMYKLGENIITCDKISNSSHFITDGTYSYWLNNGVWQYFSHNYDAVPNYYVGTTNGYSYNSETNMKVFDSFIHANAYLESGLTDGWINRPPFDLEQDGVLDETIPVPQISFEFNGAVPIGFSLENSSTVYFVEIKGRFYSADDFEYYRTKAGLSGKWQLRYYRTITGNLDQWISVNDEKHSYDIFYFETVASDSFNAFLISNPPENRTFRDPVGSTYYTEVDYPLIFNPESDLIHVLGDIRYALNAKEFYVRYWFEDNGVLKYGKWAHALQSLPDSDDAEVAYLIDSDETKGLFMQSDKGLTSNDIDTLENTGNSARDKDLVKSYTSSSFDDLSLNSALGEFSDIMHRFGDITNGISGFVVSGMSFFPWWVPYLLGFGIGCVVLLRFIGR